MPSLGGQSYSIIQPSIDHIPNPVVPAPSLREQGAMVMNNLWIWLVVGLVPYYMRRQYTPDGTRVVTLRALFWSLHVQRTCSGHYDWTVEVPLIKQLRDAV
jgi:hypothetical protein